MSPDGLTLYHGAGGRLWGINPNTGARSVLAQHPDPNLNISGLAVYVPEPDTLAPLAFAFAVVLHVKRRKEVLPAEPLNRPAPGCRQRLG
ncbi:hypothetical protein RAS1_35210 [Phycisphaerae bacterium RAS1]|nr:hypothetical protein RAS1_35210 [Phycisphaerae bacterium RAS1]